MEVIKKGPWTPEEDAVLFNYITHHGEGHWNSVARFTGLKRTGKSCRLRWLNYLRPNVRRGNISLEEQVLILELHFRWGNRWSKIAQFLPGRTDNEIKNYWRTRVQKQAKHLNCAVGSHRFRDAMRFVWIPRLLEQIRATSGDSPTAAESRPVNSDAHALQIVPASSSESEVAAAESVDEFGSGQSDLEAGWLDGVDTSLEMESLWTEENIQFLQQHLFD